MTDTGTAGEEEGAGRVDANGPQGATCRTGSRATATSWAACWAPARSSGSSSGAGSEVRAETGWGLGEHGRCQLAVHEGRADCVPKDRQPGLTLDGPHRF